MVANFWVADKIKSDVEHIAEEIGDFVIGHALAEHVPGGQPSLLDGIVPVLDATANVKNGIEEARYVSGSEDVRQVCLEISVNHDAVVNFNSASAQEFDLRRHAGRHQCHFAR